MMLAIEPASGGLASEPTPSKQPFGRLPTTHLGRILDGTRAGAYASHLLAIKAGKGRGYALNETTCKTRYGIGERSFRAGLKHLQDAGILNRRRRGRSYAVESLTTGNASYVELRDSLLTLDTSIVAFILAVKLSPKHSGAQDIAARIGVKSRTSIRKLVKLARETGEIAIGIGDRGEVLVARNGYNFDLAKNVVIKNVVAKNVAIHSSLTEAHTKKKKNPQRRPCDLSHGTCEHDPQKPEGFRGAETGKDLASLEVKVLADWKAARCFQRISEWDHEGNWEGRPWLGLTFSGVVSQVMDLEKWLELLNQYGGAPVQACSGYALDQALQIAHELEAVDPDVMVWEALHGIAFAICEAHGRGKTIRSLGFISERLIRRARSGDKSWVYGLPGTLSPEQMIAARKWAAHLLPFLQNRKISISVEAAFASYRLEKLHAFVVDDLCKNYGSALAQKALELAAERYAQENGAIAHSLTILERTTRELLRGCQTLEQQRAIAARQQAAHEESEKKRAAKADRCRENNARRKAQKALPAY